MQMVGTLLNNRNRPILSHLKLWIAVASHNFKLIKIIQIRQNGQNIGKIYPNLDIFTAVYILIDLCSA